LTFLPFLFAAAGFDVVCCDADCENLGYADRVDEASSLTRLRVGFEQCLLEELPFPEGAFQAVVCVSAIEHVRSAPDVVLESLAQVTAPGGRLVLTCDVDLRGTGDIRLDCLGVILKAFEHHFEPAFPIDLRRPPTLLTSDHFEGAEQWRLPAVWRWREGPQAEPLRSLAVLGLTGVRRPT
jgi:SAM-dependent methyltransferase